MGGARRVRGRLAAAGALLLAAGCATADERPARSPGRAGAEPACRPMAASRSRLALVVLGSGGPGSAGRAASSYLLLLDGEARVLVDAGPGAFVRLGELGIDTTSLDIVLLTHLHVDHAGDLPGFVKARNLSSDGPLTFRVFGPAGGGDYPSTTAFIERLFGESGAFPYLKSFRNELRFDAVDLPAAADAPPKAVLEQGGLRITSIAVDHDDAPAVAYRVEFGGAAVVLSGDLASRNDNLARLARGAGLVVYDTTVLDPPGSPETLYDLHTSPRRIGEVAAAAGVSSLLLSHLPRAIAEAREDVMKSVRRSFRGDARFAEDCMRLDVSTR